MPMLAGDPEPAWSLYLLYFTLLYFIYLNTKITLHFNINFVPHREQNVFPLERPIGKCRM